MGEEVRTESKRVVGESEPKTDTAGGQRSANTRTRTPETGGKRAGGRTDTNAPEPEGKSEELLELAKVETPVPVPEKKPAKKRTRKKKQAKQPSFSATQIQTLILAVSGIISAKEGMEIFAISEEESKQIAEPLAQIIIDSGYSETVGKYGNYIALVTACLMIFAPRFIVFAQQQKAKKIQKQGGLKLEPVKQERKTTGNDSTNNKPTTGTKQTNDNSVLSSIPSLA